MSKRGPYTTLKEGLSCRSAPTPSAAGRGSPSPPAGAFSLQGGELLVVPVLCTALATVAWHTGMQPLAEQPVGGALCWPESSTCRVSARTARTAARS
jgi:hypothetical protein